jgi:hypothetical protein
MKLGDEIVYMSLPDKVMLCVPNIYREMLKSFNNIREHVIFQHNLFEKKSKNKNKKTKR